MRPRSQHHYRCPLSRKQFVGRQCCPKAQGPVTAVPTAFHATFAIGYPQNVLCVNFSGKILVTSQDS